MQIYVFFCIVSNVLCVVLCVLSDIINSVVIKHLNPRIVLLMPKQMQSYGAHIGTRFLIEMSTL